MNKVVKKKWLEALRSGDYKQGREYLCNNNTYCCLGVLCDIATKDPDVDLEVSSFNDHKVVCKKYNSNIAYLPSEVAKWADLTHRDPKLLLGNLKKLEISIKKIKDFSGDDFLSDTDDISISDLNDAGYSFEEIAKLIERVF